MTNLNGDSSELVERMALAIATRRGSKVVQHFHRADARAALTASNHGELSERVGKLEGALVEARPLLEPARLRELAGAMDGTVMLCPIRQLCKRIDALLTDGDGR